MDPLSISASIIAILQATGEIVSFTVHYAAACKEAPWDLSKVLEELRGLRSILESLEQLSRNGEGAGLATASRLNLVEELCDPEYGPIAKELSVLDMKLRPPNWASREGSKRKALMQSLTWPLKKEETERALRRIERLKSSLDLALNVDQTAIIAEPQQSQKREFKSLKDFLKSESDRELYWAIIGWLSAPSPSKNYKEALKRRHKNTGLWFLNSQQFRNWRAAQGSFLWLHGMLGCGKTVVSSTIVEHLRGISSSFTAYFYFSFNDSEKQSSDKMLRSLIVQLFSGRQSMPQPVISLFESCHKGATQPQVEELEGLLKALIDVEEQTYIVLDALDECQDSDELLESLQRLIKWHHKKLNVRMTSRKHKNFEDFFNSELGPQGRMSIQNNNVDKDIRLYVRGRLQSDKQFSKPWKQEAKAAEVRAEIENKLMEKSDGMFRWAFCQLDVLTNCLNMAKLRRALESLPESLDETYDCILCNIDGDYRQEVLCVLQWLICSMRPLSLNEAAEIFAFDVEDDFKFDQDRRLPDPEDPFKLCSSLVVSVGDTNKNGSPTIRLAHFSVKEYLVSDRIRTGPAAFYSIDETLAHAVIGKTCLSCSSLFEKALGSEEYPLAEYSGTYWDGHIEYA